MKADMIANADMMRTICTLSFYDRHVLCYDVCCKITYVYPSAVSAGPAASRSVGLPLMVYPFSSMAMTLAFRSVTKRATLVPEKRVISRLFVSGAHTDKRNRCAELSSQLLLVSPVALLPRPPKNVHRHTHTPTTCRRGLAHAHNAQTRAVNQCACGAPTRVSMARAHTQTKNPGKYSKCSRRVSL